MSIRLNTAYLNDFIAPGELEAMESELDAACKTLENASGEGADFLGWLRLPLDYDRAEFARIQAAAERIRGNSDVLVVIGIGGSYIGSRAVIELLGSQYFNDFSPLKVYFAGNNISGDALNRILKLCEGKRVSVNVVSKSGTTTEPALAFRVFKELLAARYGAEGARGRIYVTTDKARGALKSLADRAGYETFVIPDDVGGRFSVLTAVGLLPIAAAGFDIEKLMAGAAAACAEYAGGGLDNACNRYAALRNILYRKGKIVEMLCCYEPHFTSFLEWWKQLFGESEGKDQKGILPASLVLSTDLHSMGQYMQDGLRILFETVVRFRNPLSDRKIPCEAEDFDGLGYLEGSAMSHINNMATDGTILAHTQGGVPCIEIEADGFDEDDAGRLIYFFERACGISAYLLGVNPFNQPGVESYKMNMFALLGKPGYEAERAALLQKIENGGAGK